MPTGVPKSAQFVRAGLLDRKSESWDLGAMKTTLDLPADLVREMELRAAHEGRNLRDMATEIFRRGLSKTAPSSERSGHRVKLPLIQCHTPTTDLTPEQVAEALLKQEVEWIDEATRR